MVAREEDKHDDTKGPAVDLGPVGFTTEDLRSHVGDSALAAGERRRVGASEAGEAEVGELDVGVCVVRGEEEVLRLEGAVRTREARR